MNRREIVGVILAGGRGTRMAPFSSRYPKPILPICNKPLIEYHLDAMAEVGITDVYIVLGYLGYEISVAIGNEHKMGMRIHYVEQSETLGIAHALGQLQTHIRSSFLLFLGDIFFRTTGFLEMIDEFRSRETGSFLVVKEDEPEEIRRNFAVVLEDGTRRVRRVIEKPRYTHNRLKGCGLYLFDLPIFDAIRRTPRTAMRDEYELTDSIQILIDDGELVEVSNVIQEDMNLTNPHDLFRCNMSELERRGIDNLIHENSLLHPDARFRRCVIGNGAEIQDPLIMENCVVFSNAAVHTREKMIRNYVITPEAAVECLPWGRS